MCSRKQGKAARGSQLWLQKFVNEQARALSKTIIEVTPALGEVRASVDQLPGVMGAPICRALDDHDVCFRG